MRRKLGKIERAARQHVLTPNEGERERGENGRKSLRLQGKPEKRVARPLESHQASFPACMSLPCSVAGWEKPMGRVAPV